MVGCHEPSGGTGRDRVRPTTAACPFGSRLFLLVVSGIPGRPVLRGQLFACRFFAFCCDLANEAGTGKTGRHHWIVLRSKPTTPKNGPAHRGCSFPHISRDPRHLWVWHPRRPWNETSGGRCASPAPLKPCLPNVLMAIDTRRLSFPSVGETHHAKDITETPSDSLLIEGQASGRTQSSQERSPGRHTSTLETGPLNQGQRGARPLWSRLKSENPALSALMGTTASQKP